MMFCMPHFFITTVPAWTYFDRGIICMTKAVLNMEKKKKIKMLPTSLIFRQTQTKPTPNPEQPCEVCVAKPVISV